MKKISVADATLLCGKETYNFKEKLEIARQLEKLGVDVIEIPAIENIKTDVLFIKTISAFVQKAVISVGVNSELASVEKAIDALAVTSNSRVRIELPISPIGMEYVCHKKGAKMLSYIEEAVALAKGKVKEVELSLLDVTRAEDSFIEEVILTANKCQVDYITISDDAGETLPDDFTLLIEKVTKLTKIPVGVSAINTDGLALSKGILSLKKGVSLVKTSFDRIPLKGFAELVKKVGDKYGFSTNLKYTELSRIISQIEWVNKGAKEEKTVVSTNVETSVKLDSSDDLKSIKSAVNKLGYDLSEEDYQKVYEEFLRVAQKKNVGAKELDAIVASVALQVPATYKLVSYIVNNGNIMPSSAQIQMTKGEKKLQGVCIGDGPIDACFRTIEQIIGHHYELDDFQIQSVTEGKEAMGLAVVKLRANGRIYSGNGISTDIIGSSIRAYINAINKIVYGDK